MVKKNENIKIIVTIVLLVVVFLVETMILPSLVMTSFINKNTAAYMLFDVPMYDHWNAYSEYSWNKVDDSYKEHINPEWSDAIADTFLEEYTTEYYVDELIDIIVENTSLVHNDLFGIFYVSSFGSYTNEYIKMQAGFLVGDNMLPTPDFAIVQDLLDKAIALVKNDELNEWYASNRVALAASIQDSMIRTSNYFAEKTLSDDAFGEACMVLKVVNVLILFYTLLAIIVIISYAAVKIFKNKYTWLCMAITQWASAIACIAVYSSLSDLGLVVLGFPFTPTSDMIKDVLPIFIAVFVIEVALGFGFYCLKFYRTNPLKSVIKRK